MSLNNTIEIPLFRFLATLIKAELHGEQREFVNLTLKSNWNSVFK